MTKIIQTLSSRTAWTTVIMFLINTVPLIEGSLSPQWKALVDAILGLMIVYFHLNPSQNYTQ